MKNYLLVCCLIVIYARLGSGYFSLPKEVKELLGKIMSVYDAEPDTDKTYVFMIKNYRNLQLSFPNIKFARKKILIASYNSQFCGNLYIHTELNS